MQPTNKPLSILPFTAHAENPSAAAYKAAAKAAKWLEDQRGTFTVLLISESQVEARDFVRDNRYAHTYTLTGYGGEPDYEVDTGEEEAAILEQVDRLPARETLRKAISSRIPATVGVN